MRLARVPIFIVTLLVVSAWSAHAASITLTDVFTPDPPPVLSDTADSYELEHFIILQAVHPSTNVLTTTIDGLDTPGADYDPATDTLLDGMLSLFFDVSSTNHGRLDLFLDGQQFLNHELFQATITIGTVEFDVGLLATDGRLTVLIDRTNASGEVTFTGSTLVVNATREDTETPNSVPEPASLVLFGVGAAAAGLRVRRRFAA